MSNTVSSIAGVTDSNVSSINGVLAANINTINGVIFSYSLPLSASPEELIFPYVGPPCTTNTVTVTAGAGVNWTATSSQSWCVVTGGSGTGNGSFTVALTGGTSVDRNAVINITSSDPTVIIAVSQEEFCS